jgi:hypothetical protein
MDDGMGKCAGPLLFRRTDCEEANLATANAVRNKEFMRLSVGSIPVSIYRATA